MTPTIFKVPLEVKDSAEVFENLWQCELPFFPVVLRQGLYHDGGGPTGYLSIKVYAFKEESDSVVFTKAINCEGLGLTHEEGMQHLCGLVEEWLRERIQRFKAVLDDI